MWLYFAVISPEGQKRSHTFSASDLESHFALLNHFVNIGYQLCSAYLIDEVTHRIDLPIEAFDGEPIAGTLKELEMEYQQVLSS